MNPLLSGPAVPAEEIKVDHPVEAAPVVEEKQEEAEVVEAVMTEAPTGEKVYPSLYDKLPTTIAAIAIGIGIIGGIQWIVRKIFSSEKLEHKALTQFVTAMFALIVGVWIADKLIAGPSTELLLPGESSQLLTFIKDITLMVFSYYFGTKANVPSDVVESEVSDG
jgi:uncharacterized protein YneF (UPF0154 family)